MKTPPAVREWLSKIGSKGGKSAAARRTPERRSEIARNAVLARWAKYRAEQQARNRAKGAR